MSRTPSILQTDRHCWACGKLTELEEHHVFFGPKR